jgi:alpha-beta hydrolase superfamily lysophospholipase
MAVNSRKRDFDLDELRGEEKELYVLQDRRHCGPQALYREAGDPSKPTIVLLHGFPSSSYQFHDLIPRLADRFHAIAPDNPGVGFSDAPG